MWFILNMFIAFLIARFIHIFGMLWMSIKLSWPASRRRHLEQKWVKKEVKELKYYNNYTRNFEFICEIWKYAVICLSFSSFVTINSVIIDRCMVAGRENPQHWVKSYQQIEPFGLRNRSFDTTGWIPPPSDSILRDINKI